MNLQTIMGKMNDHQPAIIGENKLKKSAILIPLIQKNEEPHLLFEVRSQNLRHQPGDISFPGGKVDAQDRTEQDTAIRETSEELGIDAEEITQVFPFDYMISPFGMKVSTYVGAIDCPESHIQPNPDEVEEVFTVPLSFFIDTKPKIHYVHFDVKPEEDFPFDLIVGGRDYQWRQRKIEEYFYVYKDKVIWGLTAGVIAHFVEMLKK